METLLSTCAQATLFLLVGIAQAAAPATVPERLRDSIAHIAPQLRPELHKDGGIEIHGGPKSAGTVYADNVEKACAQEPDHCDEAIQTRDWILAVKADDTAAVHKLRDVAGRIVRGEPYSVTADQVRWDGKTWQPVQP